MQRVERTGTRLRVGIGDEGIDPRRKCALCATDRRNRNEQRPPLPCPRGQRQRCRQQQRGQPDQPPPPQPIRPDAGEQSKSTDRPIPGGENFPANKEELHSTLQFLADSSVYSRRQIEAMWELCGTRIEQFLSQHQPHSDEVLVDTDLPLEFVRWSIHNEWVKHLGDLVERRLMLLYQPLLSEATLHQLGEVLATETEMPRETAAFQVQETIARLREHFGKRLTSQVPQE